MKVIIYDSINNEYKNIDKQKFEAIKSVSNNGARPLLNQISRDKKFYFEQIKDKNIILDFLTKALKADFKIKYAERLFDKILNTIYPNYLKKINEDIGKKEFLLKFFFDYDKETKRFIYSPEKASRFIDIVTSDDKDMSIEKKYLLTILGAELNDDNRISVEENKLKGYNDEDIGWLFEILEELDLKNGFTGYKEGDIFWEGRSSKQVKELAESFLYWDYTTNGLLNYSPDEINKFQAKYSELLIGDFITLIQEPVLETKDEATLKQEINANGVTENLDGKDKKELISMLLEIYKQKNANTDKLKYLTGQPNWYNKKTREIIDEYFDAEEWFKNEVLTNIKADEVIKKYAKQGESLHYKTIRSKQGRKNKVYYVQLDPKKLKTLGIEFEEAGEW